MKSLPLVLFVAILACLPASASESGGAPGRPRGGTLPNIILVLADDLGWGELGSYGQEKIRTPNLDRMAAEGMRFTQWYSGAPVCAPARCNLMTGKHAGHAAIRDNGEITDHQKRLNGATLFGGQAPLPGAEVTVAELLKSKGYVTGGFGKWGLGAAGTEGDPLQQGFDHFFGYNCQRHAHNLYPRYLDRNGTPVFLEGNTRGVTGEQYAPQLIADGMLQFIEQHADQPFFVYYPTVLPHLPLQVPQADLEAYLGQWRETPYPGGSYQPHPTPRACYAAMITFLDRQMGRIFSLLREKGIEENTLVIFTSDNGSTFLKAQVDYPFFRSVGNLRGLKGSVYEGGIRVPFIARWPGRIPAAVSGHVGAHYDVLATLADVIDVPPPTGTDGISILPALLGSPDAQREHPYLFWDFAGYGGQLAVRMGDWKGVKRNLRKDPDAPLELYHLRDDPSESKNVAGEHPETAAEIERIMVDARTRPDLPGFRFGSYRRAPDPRAR